MHLYDTANENHPTQIVQSIYYNISCINTRPTNKVIVELEHSNVLNAYDVFNYATMPIAYYNIMLCGLWCIPNNNIIIS